MNRTRALALLLAVAVPLAFRAEGAWAIGGPGETDWKIARQAEVLSDRLGLAADRLTDVGIKEPAVLPALFAVGVALDALSVLIYDPDLREAQVEALAASRDALEWTALVVEDPNIRPGPELGRLRGTLAAAREACAKLARLIGDPM